MKNKNNAQTLHLAIQSLKEKQKNELILLKTQFEKTYEGFRPLNILKNTISEVTTSPDLRNSLVNNAIGLATGYLSKKFLLGSTHNPIKKILGTIVEFGIANFVAKKVNDYTHEETTSN